MTTLGSLWSFCPSSKQDLRKNFGKKDVSVIFGFTWITSPRFLENLNFPKKSDRVPLQERVN